MSAPRLDFKAIKERADFETVLARTGVTVKRDGAELLGLCPFHNETRPSFRVNPEKGLFHCFGCGAGGNVLDYVVRKERLTLRQAAARLAEWSALPSDAVQRQQRTVSEPAPVQSSDPPSPSKPLSFRLRLSAEHPYLERRGLKPETIAAFGVGYASRGMMKGRICVPIENETGELLAYAGRYAGDPVPDDEKKYLLPPAFKKSDVLFNLHRVATADHLVVVEGFFSVMRLHELEIPAVAVMGCTVSPRQEEVLVSSNAERLTLLFDGDEAGWEGALEALLNLSRRLFVRLATVPEGTQPDTLSDSELRRLIQKEESCQ